MKIGYIENTDRSNLYFGLCDRIKIPKLTSKEIHLDLEKILGKNNVRNIQGIRLRQEDLKTEIDKLNNINRILLILIIIFASVNLISAIKG
tara:strand:+ start:65 stop:337 length:273 start_codon:yes stop_codon:yes gene_type:complete